LLTILIVVRVKVRVRSRSNLISIIKKMRSKTHMSNSL